MSFSQVTWRRAALPLLTVIAIAAIFFGLNQNATARQWQDLERSRNRDSGRQVSLLQSRVDEAVLKQQQAESRVNTLANQQAQAGDRSEEIRVLAARAARLEPLLDNCVSATPSESSCLRTVQDARAVLLALQSIDAEP